MSYKDVLLSPLKIGNRTAQNRFFMQAMEGNEGAIKYCTACDNCLELLIQQSKVGCSTYNKRYTEELVRTRKEKGRLKVMHT